MIYKESSIIIYCIRTRGESKIAMQAFVIMWRPSLVYFLNQILLSKSVIDSKMAAIAKGNILKVFSRVAELCLTYGLINSGGADCVHIESR